MGFFEGILYMLWRGLAIGVIISAPMGPVGILCVQRTLEKGRYTGFFTGIGAALSDLFYCLRYLSFQVQSGTHAQETRCRPFDPPTGYIAGIFVYIFESFDHISYNRSFRAVQFFAS